MRRPITKEKVFEISKIAVLLALLAVGLLMIIAGIGATVVSVDIVEFRPRSILWVFGVAFVLGAACAAIADEPT